MPLWISMTTLPVLAAASGVKARSLDTTSAIMVRPSGVVPMSSTLTKREARSRRWEISTASAYGAVSFQSDFSPVVSRSGGDALVLAASDAAAFAAGGSKAEWGAIGSCAQPSAARATDSVTMRSMRGMLARNGAILSQDLGGLVDRQRPYRVAVPRGGGGLQQRVVDRLFGGFDHGHK